MHQGDLRLFRLAKYGQTRAIFLLCEEYKHRRDWFKKTETGRMRRSPADGRPARQSNGAGNTCRVDAKTLEKKRCDGTADAGETDTQTSNCI